MRPKNAPTPSLQTSDESGRAPSGPGHRDQRAFRIVTTCGSLLAVLAAPACGADDSNRKVQHHTTVDGGDDTGGKSGGTGGKSGGTGGKAAGGTVGSDGGTAGTGGAGGSGGEEPDASSGGGGQDTGGTDGGDSGTSSTGGGSGTGGTKATGGASGTGGSPNVCTAGKGDCDGLVSTVCETNLNTDNAHCGSCDRNCTAGGSTCSAGSCAAIPMATNQPFGTDGGYNRTWAYDADAAYWVGNFSYGVRRYPYDGSAPTVIWDASQKVAGNQSAIVSGGEIYWAERGTPPVFVKKSVTAAATVLPSLVFTPEYQPTFMKLQGTTLYWANGDYQSGDPAGYIYSRPLAAASTVAGTRIVTTNQGTHGAILEFTATANALYWTTSFVDATSTTAFDLRTAPLAGGAVTSVPGGAISSGGINQFETVGNTLYYIRNAGDSFLNGLYKYQTGDAAPTQLVSAENVTSFQMDATSFYFTEQNVTGVFKAPLAGGAAVVISSSSASKVVAQDATYVYTIVSGCCSSNMFKVLK